MASKAIISNYRTGRHIPKQNHLILIVDGCDTRETAQKFVGKEVSWTTASGKKLVGKIASAHGNKGALRAVFPKGLPGQCRGTEVEIL